jgi:hypothetical protein
MFRHDPKALLYAPLRLVIHADAEGNAFGSLGIADVTKVGESLDRKVANLLRVSGVDADQAFGCENGESGGERPRRIRPWLARLTC